MSAASPLRRGDVVHVRLDPVTGSEQVGERPGVVISPDVINELSPVILIAPITSRKTERIYPFEALIEPPQGGLRERSKVLLMQVRALDRRRISPSHGSLTPETMERVNAALAVAIGFTRLI